jgi:anti-sigma B factor antagonist
VNEDYASVVITMPETLNIRTARGVHDALVKLQDFGATRVIADLSCATYVDSMGLGVLVSAYARLRDADGWLAVAGPGERTMRLFAATGLTRVISLHDTVQDAINAAPLLDECSSQNFRRWPFNWE